MQVTIRDLTVRAADQADMASLYLNRRASGGGQSRNWMCYLDTGEG